MTTPEIFGLLRFARAYCAEKLPWFAPALYECKIYLTKAVPVAAISDNMYIYFNPDAVAIIHASGAKQAVLAQLAFLWVHEISHILRKHSERAAEINADAQLWNIAADLEINDAQWQGLKPPQAFKGIFPKDFELPEGKLTEWYYRQILQNLNLAQKLRLAFANGLADEGSGVHHQNRSWENPDANTQQSETLSPLQKELICRQVAQEMQNAAKQQGSLPGNWEIWVNEILQPTINWRKILAKRMGVAIAQGVGMRIDYTFSRPNRRQAQYHPILPPSLSGNMEPRIACVIDTSGSMTNQYVAQALAEVFSLLETFHAPVTLIPCDAIAYQPITLAQPTDRFKTQTLPGGGGTDMIAGIHAALALQPPPDTVLVLTDGYTDYPPMPNKTPVIFGIIKESYNNTTPLPNMPPWARESVVEIVL